MAGLLAWAADVVGAGGSESASEDSSIPILFSESQKTYVRELDHKANSLQRSIQDLRLRLPPPDISQRLPHLHAHSLASNNALALQLNAHSSTRHQAQLREETLKEENAAFQNAISNCESKIKEKVEEAELLRRKLEEMDEAENKLRAELENIHLRTSVDAGQSWIAESSEEENKMNRASFDAAAEVSKSAMLDKLEEKKKELVTFR
ncbi:golgin subfamily A member 5-like protein [Trifolium pratense]|uniref:Golgin subfamily A member 5-like protein n=1 Tax=Trifolium pratense TaxID=57577 RepID=A0A2K3NCL1_TRIPR|nr:golgin subfamily A member 5-like protein [Trifolium pratense]PNY00782.1 golgin subfamily A member 5-like protein [Trifolium pratense]PNY11213.1 golgin subfamily A member 5-like protein [Trifolium pratense]